MPHHVIYMPATAVISSFVMMKYVTVYGDSPHGMTWLLIIILLNTSNCHVIIGMKQQHFTFIIMMIIYG